MKPHAPSDNDRVRCSTKAYEAPKSCDRRDRWSGSVEKRRQLQRDAEMNDRRRRKRGAGLRGGYRRPLDNERHDHELKADQAPGAEPTIT